MNLGIDIDNTISASLEAIDYYAKEFTEKYLNRKFEMKELEEYTKMWYLEAYGWTIQEDEEFLKLYQYKALENAKPKKYVKEVLDELSKKNKIFLITARENELKDITLKWLEENQIKYDEIIFEKEDKAKIVVANNIDIFIDDNINMCKSVKEKGVKVLLMNTRKNRKIDIDGVQRVFDWNEIKKIID